MVEFPLEEVNYVDIRVSAFLQPAPSAERKVVRCNLQTAGFEGDCDTLCICPATRRLCSAVPRVPPVNAADPIQKQEHTKYEPPKHHL